MKVLCAEVNSTSNYNLISEIANGCGILYDTARLLVARTIDSVEKAQAQKNQEKPKTQAKYKQREYTDDEFDALFEDLKNIEL